MQLTERFERAVSYAVAVHGFQRRKGTKVPYVAHLLGVASLVMEHGGTEEEAIGALLHDAGEDAGGEVRVEDIRARFGAEVEAIVRGCSDTLAKQKEPWEERKRKYLKHLPEASRSVQLVSAADKVYNATSILRDLHTIGEAVWEKFSVPRERTLWYYRGLVRAYRREYCAGLVEELERVVREVHRITGVEWS